MPDNTAPHKITGKKVLQPKTPTATPSLSTSRPHFAVLDGLRGIAAIAVVIFHFMEMGIPNEENFIAHGYLGVDFFFCLSGFVIPYAYDARLAQIGLGTFFKQRLIRLHPLVILGSLLGLIVFLFDPFGDQASGYSFSRLAIIFLVSILMIPYPVMGERAYNNFGLNAPAWSLFWEYVVNIVYAVALVKAGKKMLFFLAVISAILLCRMVYIRGNISGGWAGNNFWDGGIRMSYSFLAGMLVYRTNFILKNRLGFAGIALLLALAFIVPYKTEWNIFTEPFIVIFYFPLLVSLGAGSVLKDRSQNLCRFSGDISYPLYMTHYAVLWSFGNYYAAYKPDGKAMAIIILIALVVLISFAWLVMRFYDVPVRKYLLRRMNKK